jgi:hypothetical protein
MKSIQKLIFFAFSTIIFVSCQDVIDIELRDADRRYVIEGAVTQGVDSAIVRVSRTTSFFDTAEPEAIGDAQVLLTLPDGSQRTLLHTENGYYIVRGINPMANASYSLNVQVGGQTFTASAFMPDAVPLDSLTYRPEEILFGPQPEGPPKQQVYLHFQDPVSTNYYRVTTIANGYPYNKLENLQVFDDRLTNGNYIEIPIFYQRYLIGDTVDVSMLTMDASVYTFLETFSSAASADAGSPFSATPDNPISNIKGGALGVFAAYGRSELRVILVP